MQETCGACATCGGQSILRESWGPSGPQLTTRRTGRPRRSPRPPAAGRRGVGRADWHRLRLRLTAQALVARHQERRRPAGAGASRAAGPPSQREGAWGAARGSGWREQAGTGADRLCLRHESPCSAPRWGGERLPGRAAAHLDGGLNLLLLGGGEHHHAPGGASLRVARSGEAAERAGPHCNSFQSARRCGWWRQSALAGPTHLAAQGLGGPGRDGGAHGDGLHGCGAGCGCGSDCGRPLVRSHRLSCSPAAP